jgi:hypothetical protein
MGGVETITGKLSEVDLGELTLSQKISELLKEKVDSVPDYCTDEQDAFADLLSDEYFIYKGRLFALEYKDLDSQDFIEITKSDDGTYKFTTSFYNGCTCLGEMLSDGLEEIGE